MSGLGRLEISVIGNVSKFTKSLDDAVRQSRIKSKQIRDSFKNIEKLGNNMSRTLSLPIAGAAAGIVKVASDFEASMKRVEAKSGATGESLQALEDVAKNLGINTKYSAGEAAGAIEMLIKNGVSVKDVLDGAVDSTLKLAAATDTELASAADIMTDAMSLFGIQAKDAQDAVDSMTAATLKSKFDLEEYKFALSAAGGVASNLGIEFEDFNAAIAAISPAFSSGKTAGTSFKRFLQLLTPSSKEAATAMKELGIDAFDAQGNFIGVEAVAGQLKSALSSLSAEAANEKFTTMFGSDASNAAFALARTGAEDLAKLSAEMKEVNAAAIAAKQQEGLEGQLKQLKSAFEGVALAIADTGLLSLITEFVTSLTGIVRGIAEVDPQILTFITAFGGIVAAAGPVISITGKIVGAILAIGNPIGLTITAISALIAAYVAFKDEIDAAVSAAVQYVKRWFTDTKAVFDETKRIVIDLINTIIEWFGAKLESAIELAKKPMDWLVGAWEKVSNILVGNSIIPDMVELIKEAFVDMGESIITTTDETTTQVTESFGTMSESVQGFLGDLKSGFKDVITGARSFGDVMESIAMNALDRFVDAKIDDIFSGMFNTGGTGGGGTKSVVGSAIQKGVIEGVKNSAVGKAAAQLWAKHVTGTYYAAGNLGFKGAGVANYGASSATTGGSISGGGGAMGGGMAAFAPGAIFAALAAGAVYMGAKEKREQAMWAKRFVANAQHNVTEALGESGGLFRGLYQGDEGIGFFQGITQEMQKGLELADLAVNKVNTSFKDANGTVQVVHGNINKVKQAIANTTVESYRFAGSMETAIEKGNGLRVNITGDFDVIKNAMNLATQQGIGGFRNLQQTASGASAIITGDIAQWDKFLQAFVSAALKSAASGMDVFADKTAGATEKMYQLIQAAQQLRSARSQADRGQLTGFATGGSFVVGGMSGRDKNLVAFRATKGERVTVETDRQRRTGAPESNGETNKLLRELIEVTRINNNMRSADLLRRRLIAEGYARQ